MNMLSSNLLALHSATGVPELWEAMLDLLREEFPCKRVTLFLGHLGQGDARKVLTDPPIEQSETWFEERASLNPFSPYINTHPGLTHYHFSDVIGPPEVFKESEFYQRFAKPEGWDKGFSGMFWNRKKEMRAMFSIYRSPWQKPFSDSEVERLLQLRPFFDVAIERVQRFHRERLFLNLIEGFNRDMPVPIVMLDWGLKPIFANREAYRCAAIWNYGPKQARAHSNRANFRIPEAIQGRLEALRQRVLKGKHEPNAERMPKPEMVFAETDIRLSAKVVISPGASDSVARPGFLVVFSEPLESALQDTEGRGSEHIKLMRLLTLAERDLVRQVCLGKSNREIAEALGKSILTVKTQLNSVFNKLNIRSRARLIALVNATE